jgi:hypothetical protein
MREEKSRQEDSRSIKLTLMKVEIDDGIYHELEAVAKRKRRSVTHLPNIAISNYCQEQKNPPNTAAPRGYGVRPDEKKRR